MNSRVRLLRLTSRFTFSFEVLVVPGVPKTRSGKIMRRILRKIACSEYDRLGDVTTLNDASVVEAIINLKRAEDQAN